jgi:BlaI family penicillinase repressor
LSTGTNISESEWEVMNVLWSESPLTSSQIAERLEQPTGWKPATVKTLLGRLVKKGQLTYETDGNRYLYRPRVSRHAAVQAESHSFLERVFRGDAASMLLHFARTAELSESEAKELRQLLDAGEDEP